MVETRGLWIFVEFKYSLRILKCIRMFHKRIDCHTNVRLHPYLNFCMTHSQSYPSLEWWLHFVRGKLIEHLCTRLIHKTYERPHLGHQLIGCLEFEHFKETRVLALMVCYWTFIPCMKKWLFAIIIAYGLCVNAHVHELQFTENRVFQHCWWLYFSIIFHWKSSFFRKRKKNNLSSYAINIEWPHCCSTIFMVDQRNVCWVKMAMNVSWVWAFGEISSFKTLSAQQNVQSIGKNQIAAREMAPEDAEREMANDL